jgi:glycosyltransferase involved in cell wall biosynthesis
VRILVAVLTFRRPRELARVVPALLDQARSLGEDAAVLVVDNDPSGGARASIEGGAARYVHEPRPGIAAARNRALDEAVSLGADALVFIDDDELPGEGWLSRLVSAWRTWECAAVSGPVLSSFEEPPDPWVVASGAFDPRVRSTGAAVPGAATNNLLLDLAAISKLGMRFDERLGLSGGEDTIFTHELVTRGGVIRWCAEAAVLEPVAQDRATKRWVLTRAYRAGTSWSAMELRLVEGRRRRLLTRMKLLTRAAVKGPLGASQWIAGVVLRNVRMRARGACQLASYTGLLAGVFGASFAEYRRQDPPGAEGGS